MGLMYCKYRQPEASKNHKAILKTRLLTYYFSNSAFQMHSDNTFDFSSRCTQVGEAQICYNSS